MSDMTHEPAQPAESPEAMAARIIEPDIPWDSDAPTFGMSNFVQRRASAERKAATILATTTARATDQAELAAFGASDAACVLYPDEGQQKERAAFCAGAAHGVSALPATGCTMEQDQ